MSACEISYMRGNATQTVSVTTKYYLRRARVFSSWQPRATDPGGLGETKVPPALAPGRLILLFLQCRLGSKNRSGRLAVRILDPLGRGG